jgi:D-3-phosphoglycerate dehydrogenase / 2-oxoglutarate reductase
MKKGFRVLVTDGLHAAGIGLLKSTSGIYVDQKLKTTAKELKQIISRYDAIIVRSQTRLTKDILSKAKRLKVIGRAGVGLDNVDIDTASKQGVVVMNAPGGNSVSTAEHTLSMLLALSRNIPQASQSIRSGQWNRKQFTGVELYGKTLGIIGLGRIGLEVARRALAFGMKVIAYDPFISKERASQKEIELVDFKKLIKNSDYITLHVPLNTDTHHLIGADELKKVKKGVRIVNCARGGLIDEAALVQALRKKQVSGVALDVFETEPPKDHALLKFENVIATPHLGAATHEAQVHVAHDIAQQVADCLSGKGIRNAVNMAFVDPAVAKSVQPFVDLAEKVGSLQSQLVSERFSRVDVRYSGEVTRYDVAPITLSLLKGLLTPLLESHVNLVNAPILARERGIKVTETKISEVEDFANLITIRLRTEKGTRQVSGTLFARGVPRIVRVDDHHVDAIPSGYMLFIKNLDRPGTVGMVGTQLARSRINIADMTLGRGKRGGEALTVINVDQNVSPKVLRAIRRARNIVDVRLVKL